MVLAVKVGILSIKNAPIKKLHTNGKTVCNLKPKEEKEKLRGLPKSSKNTLGAQMRKCSDLVHNLIASLYGQNSNQIKRL
jgi:hypothetical protein